MCTYTPGDHHRRSLETASNFPLLSLIEALAKWKREKVFCQEELLRKTYHQQNSVVISQSRLTCPSIAIPFITSVILDCQKMFFWLISYFVRNATAEGSILASSFRRDSIAYRTKKLNDITREIRSISVDHRHAAIHRPEEERCIEGLVSHRPFFFYP